MEQQKKKILLGILVANGDCLLATVIARQIKVDFPGCHLTWAVSNLCRQIVENNPDVDEIWEINIEDKKAAERQAWFDFVRLASERKEMGEYDDIFLVQVYPSNVHQYDGTTRGTIYNCYPGKITVSARPVLRLTQDEVNQVKLFAEEKKLQQYKHVILFECSSFSGQSFVTPEWALLVSEKITDLHNDLVILISTHLPLKVNNERIIIVNNITLRQNAELTKYCTLLVGCSSGITWVATTDWAKRLPMIQFLKRGIGFTFASVAYDHKYWNLDDSLILESTESDVEKAVSIINHTICNGIIQAKDSFHQPLRPRFISMLKYSFMFFRKGNFSKSMNVLKKFISRNYLTHNKYYSKSRLL